MNINYKQAYMRLTGATAAEYRTAYNRIAAQTRNYNALAGTNLKASQVLYITERYKGDLSATIQDVLNTPATRAHKVAESVPERLGETSTKRVTDAATQTLLDRWKPFIDESERARDSKTDRGSGDAAKVAQDLKDGLITPAQANEALKQIKADLSVKHDKDPTYKY
jgi:hypothetical protein